MSTLFIEAQVDARADEIDALFGVLLRSHGDHGVRKEANDLLMVSTAGPETAERLARQVKSKRWSVELTLRA